MQLILHRSKMDVNQKLVSIVVPAYNVEKYICELIDEIILQDYNNWELLIVDDGSTDATQKEVLKYCKKDKRIKLIKRNRNPKGAQTCRNIGISLATGDYIIIIDADDCVEKCMLSQRVRYMETHESIYYATARGQSFYINKNGNRILGRMWGEYCEDDLLQCFLETNYSFSVWNNIYRADFVKRFVFDEEVKVYQDFDFIVRILLQNYKHGFIKDSKVDYLYRQGHSGTITSTFISSEKYNSTKYLFEKISELISNVSDEKKYKAAFFKFYLLQYERVLIYGTKEQCLDYYEFITKRYSYKYNRRLKLTKKLVEIRQKESLTSRKVRIVLYMLFDYKKIIDWINQKLRYRTFNI